MRIKVGLIAYWLLATVLHVDAQELLKLNELARTNLPKGINHTGLIHNAVRWEDKGGENIVITTQTGETPSKSSPDGAHRDAALYAYHYLVVKDSARLTWKIYDFVKECPMDIEALFVKNTFQITDLNNDGLAEIWVMYRVVCRGDVSPSNMKIIMYHGTQKFAMRGQNKVEVTKGQFIGGEYKFDKAFMMGPAPFRDFALALWNKNILQKWDE